MVRHRPIHDCPYCGRTKFADETLSCCVDPDWQEHCAKVAAYLKTVAETGKEPTLSHEAEAQVERAMRRHERRELQRFDAGLGSYLDTVEEFSQ